VTAISIAIVGGALLATSFVFDWAWWCVFLGVTAFVVAIEWNGPRGRWVLASVAFGWTAYIGGYHWLQPALSSLWGGRTALSWAVWLGLAAWFLFRFVAVGGLYRALRRRGVGIVLSISLPWLSVEWLFPSLFPFFIANPLIERPRLVQAAALGGPLLLSAWVCAVSGVLAALVMSRRGAEAVPRWHFALLAAATVALLAYGEVALRGLERIKAEADTLAIGVVQANVDVIDKRTERALSHRRHVAQSRALENEGEVDLLVWPETAVLQPLAYRLPITGALVRSDLSAPVLFGAVTAHEAGDVRRRFNSALLVGRDDMIRSGYHKRFLIPFAEFVPFGERFASWARVAPTLSRFSKGAPSEGLRLGSIRIATPICYETIRPSYVRALARRVEPHLLVSLTNDGWFGHSTEPRLHLMLARMRAVEHRRYLIRATNTGISAIVDPAGRLVATTRLMTTATLRERVPLLSGETPYKRFGNWPGFCSAMWLLFVLYRRRIHPAERGAAPP